MSSRQRAFSRADWRTVIPVWIRTHEPSILLCAALVAESHTGVRPRVTGKNRERFFLIILRDSILGASSAGCTLSFFYIITEKNLIKIPKVMKHPLDIPRCESLLFRCCKQICYILYYRF